MRTYGTVGWDGTERKAMVGDGDPHQSTGMHATALRDTGHARTRALG